MRFRYYVANNLSENDKNQLNETNSTIDHANYQIRHNMKIYKELMESEFIIKNDYEQLYVRHISGRHLIFKSESLIGA